MGEGGSRSKGKSKESQSRILLDALAKAIDGTDAAETMRLAAEFNSSFGDLVRASAGTEPDAGHGDRSLLGSFGPPGKTAGDQSQDAMLVNKVNARIVSKARKEGIQPDEIIHTSEEESTPNKMKPSKTKRSDKSSTCEVVEVTKAKKKKKDSTVSSADSEESKPRRKKLKRKSSKKKISSDSSSPSSDSSGDSSSSTESDSSLDSDEEEKAEMCYDITDFQSADLPDLPDKWDKGFKKLRSYVPLSLFKKALLESYYDDEKDQKTKDKLEVSKTSLKMLEKQLTYGDFIEMCDLEERYARDIYGLDTYADYIFQHKRIVSDLKKSYNCWMIGLRYHLKVRTVIFRRSKLIKSRVKGKTVLKDRVKIPDGLQPAVERQARHDADRAGDLQYVDNPYAVGGPKFGFNFATGRQEVQVVTPMTVEKGSDSTNPTGGQGKRGGGFKKPYVKKGPFFYNRFNRYGAEGHQGKQSPIYASIRARRITYAVRIGNQFGAGGAQNLATAPNSGMARPYFQFKNPRPVQAIEAPKTKVNTTGATV